MSPPHSILGVAICLLLLGCGAETSFSGKTENANVKTSCLKTVPAPIALAAGPTQIGSNDAYPEERPLRDVKVGAFEIDATEVTNGQFSAFVEDTGFVTDAEKPQPGFDVSGGAVFTSPTKDNPSWWHFVEGANWRHPEGPESTIEGKALYPVVQITLNDARAYAWWSGRVIPSEVEWEFAAKAGSNTAYVWGDERAHDDKEKANSWQGAFPIQNTGVDGFMGHAPVGCFEANKYGLYDMIGNVWEWTETDAGNGKSHIIKGGSFLCAENFCRRYRASARQPQEIDFSTNHIGFRTIKK